MKSIILISLACLGALAVGCLGEQSVVRDGSVIRAGIQPDRNPGTTVRLIRWKTATSTVQSVPAEVLKRAEQEFEIAKKENSAAVTEEAPIRLSHLKDVQREGIFDEDLYHPNNVVLIMRAKGTFKHSRAVNQEFTQLTGLFHPVTGEAIAFNLR